MQNIHGKTFTVRLKFKNHESFSLRMFCRIQYHIRGLFGSDFSLAVWNLVKIVK